MDTLKDQGLDWAEVRMDSPWRANGAYVLANSGQVIAETACPEMAKLMATAPRLESILSALYDAYVRCGLETRDEVERYVGDIWSHAYDALTKAGEDVDMAPPLSQAPADVARRQTAQMRAARNALFAALCLWEPDKYARQSDEWRAQHPRVLTEAARRTVVAQVQSLAVMARGLEDVIEEPASYVSKAGDPTDAPAGAGTMVQCARCAALERIERAAIEQQMPGGEQC